MFKSGECGAHSVSHLLLMSQSWNRCLSHNRALLEVWGAAPFYWNHCSSLVMVLRWPSAAQNFLSTTVVSLTILHTICKRACNAKGVICNTFWRAHKSQIIWPTDWKLQGMTMHNVKLMCTKYEVICWKHLEVISIFVGGIFLGGCPVTMCNTHTHTHTHTHTLLDW